MNKAEFLEQLDERLSVLREEERKDIRDEYAQHIDIKMSQGMSEEDAIAEFGNLKDLAADILEAYHVQADYMETKQKGSFLSGLKKGMNRAAAWMGRSFVSFRNGSCRFFAGILHAGQKGFRWLADLRKRPFADRKRQGSDWEKDEKGAHGEETADLETGFPEAGAGMDGAAGLREDEAGTIADANGSDAPRAWEAGSAAGADGPAALRTREAVTVVGMDKAAGLQGREAGSIADANGPKGREEPQGAQNSRNRAERPRKGLWGKRQKGESGMRGTDAAEGGGHATEGKSGQGVFSAVGRGFAALWNGCIGLCKWCFWLAWNCFFAGLGLFLGFFGCIALFCLAALIVFLFQGYPVAGITIGALGMTMCLGAVCVWCFTVLHRRDGKKPGNARLELGILLGTFLGGVLFGGLGTGIGFGEFSSMEYLGRVEIGQENQVTEDLDFIYTPKEGSGVRLAWVDWGDYRAQSLVKQDPSVPKNVIRYEVTYNADQVRPYLLFAENREETAAGEQTEIPAETAAEEQPETQAETAAGEQTEILAETDTEEDPGIPSEANAEEESGIPAEVPADEAPLYIDGNLFLRVRYVGDEFGLFMKVKDRILEDLRQNKIASYDGGEGISSVTVRVNPAMMEHLEDTTRKD